MGTPAYMSPEQWLGKKADARSDIYALSCTYYFLLTGRPPYEGESLPSLGYQHGHEPFPDPRRLVPEIPEGVVRVLSRGAAKDPAARYTDASEMAADLDALLGKQHAAAPVAPTRHSVVTAPAVVTPVSRSDAPTMAGELPPERPANLGNEAPSPQRLIWGTVECQVRSFSSIAYRRLVELTRWVDDRLAAVDGRGSPVHTLLRVVCAGMALLLLLVLVGAPFLRYSEGEPMPPMDAKATHAPDLEPDEPMGPIEPVDPSRLALAIAPFSAQQARAHQEAWAEHLGQPLEITNSIGMKLVLIPPGEFMMGSPESRGSPDERPQHRVRITKPFYLGVYEVTQEEYERVMGTNPSYFSRGGDGNDRVSGQDTSRFPVESVSWDDAVEFCRKLSALPAERSAGREYRLPTEAEWEYACRAGTTTRYHFGNDLSSDQARFRQSWSSNRPVPVSSYSANGFGLFDMHGNVREWCADWFDAKYYANSPVDDPRGPASGSHRVYRGGGWLNYAWDCRSANRYLLSPDIRPLILGFRLALVPMDAKATHAPDLDPDEPMGPIEPVDPSRPALATAPFSAQQARAHQEAWAEHLGQPREITNSIGMKLVLIPPGEFMMGSPESEEGRLDWEGPQHRVRITKPFYFGVYQVTQEEYERVMGTNPSAFSRGGHNSDRVSGLDTSRFPVEWLSWDDAVEFCRKLSALPAERSAGREYRLPTEAEWEYACRAGTTTGYHFGNDLSSDQAKFDQSLAGRPVPVGSYSANGFGLYDMHGNVWECCVDWFDAKYYANSPVDDPQGPASGSRRVLRGGGWGSYPRDCRSAYRNGRRPDSGNDNCGFRLAWSSVE
jgi:formylglycine-generating enzyme required for sulfatase activity